MRGVNAPPSPAEPDAQLDLGRILGSRGIKSLQRPRQVSFFVRRRLDAAMVVIVG